MHDFSYSVKRTHWKITWWAIKLFQRMAKKFRVPELADMTPARFDLLMVMWQLPPWMRRDPERVYGASLAVLTEKLGVHPTTISRCVKGLVTYGFAVVRRDPKDKRSKAAYMTKLGRKVLGAAMDALYGRDHAFLHAHALFALEAPQGRTIETFSFRNRRVNAALLALGRRLRRCAREHGSCAYPIYDPDFVDPQLERTYLAYRDPPWPTELIELARAHGALPPPLTRRQRRAGSLPSLAS